VTVQHLPLVASSGTNKRDDRVLPEVRLVATGVIVILLIAVAILYLNPDKTEQHWAWTIRTQLTALAIGAGYLMGAYFFARVIFSTRWHYVASGFLPITSFTIFMLLLTIVHWDGFNLGTLAFLLWTLFYLITPVLVPFLWWRNQQTDPGIGEVEEVQVPRVIRQAAGFGGAITILIALVVFLFPDLLIGVFPWRLNPLAARAVAGWLSFPGIGGIVLALEPRWSSWRVILEAAYIGIIFFVLALPRAWNDLDQSKPLAGALLAGLGAAIFFIPLFYVAMQRKHASASSDETMTARA
jgi:hypothetical protein